MYPCSALLTTKPIYDHCMNTDRWGYMASMAGSPIGARVASKVLEIVQRPATLENIARLEAAFIKHFAELVRAISCRVHARHDIGSDCHHWIMERPPSQRSYGVNFSNAMYWLTAFRKSLPKSSSFFPASRAISTWWSRSQPRWRILLPPI